MSNSHTCMLHNHLQEKIQLMSKPWKGCIPTEVFVCVDKESDTPTIFNHPPQLVDICEYLGGAKYPTSRLYFPSTKFPPPTSSDDMKGNNSEETCVGWRCLKRHLIRTALHNGQIIVSNGGEESERALTCSHYRLDSSWGIFVSFLSVLFSVVHKCIFAVWILIGNRHSL